jgi:hypothetical protein
MEARMNILLMLCAVFVMICYLLASMNSQHLWFNEIKNHSPIISSLKHKNKYQNLGLWLYKLLPQNLANNLSKNYHLLNRSQELLYGDLLCYFLLVILLSLINKSYLLGIGFLIFALAESFWSVRQLKRQLDKDIEHLIKCLEILIIKSELPLLNALQIIVEDLPKSMLFSKSELNKIINQAEKKGLKEVLISWDTESLPFKNLISILLSSSEGASKTALDKQIKNFIRQIEEENAEDLKNKAENLQLYLIGPALVMLIIIGYPMMDAVNFCMNNIRGN